MSLRHATCACRGLPGSVSTACWSEMSTVHDMTSTIVPCPQHLASMPNSIADFGKYLILCWPPTLERTALAQVAADALLAVAGQLAAAQPALAERLVGRADVPEHHSVDAVFQACLQNSLAVGVRDCICAVKYRVEQVVHPCEHVCGACGQGPHFVARADAILQVVLSWVVPCSFPGLSTEAVQSSSGHVACDACPRHPALLFRPVI